MTKLVLAARGEAEPEANDTAGWGSVPSGRAPLVVGLVAVPAALITLGLLLYVQNRTAPGTSQFFDPVAPAVAMTAPAIGALMVDRRPRDPTGWLFCAGGLAAVSFFAEQYAVFTLMTRPGSLPGGAWMAWLGSWTWIPGLLPLTTLVLLLFPHWRLPSRRWAPVAWAAVAAIALATASAALAPGSAGSPSPTSPAGVAGLPQLATIAQGTTAACSLVLAPLCLVGLLVRHHRAAAESRAQLRWFVWAAVPAVAAPFAGVFLPLGVHRAVGLLGLVGLSAGVAVAVARHGLYEIDHREVDLLANRAISSGALAVTAVAVYCITRLVLEIVFGLGAGVVPQILAVSAVVASWGTASRWIRDGVERLRSPRRAYHALIGLGRCLEANIDPDDVLPAMASTIAAALELPYVAVEVGRAGEVTAAALHGEPRQDAPPKEVPGEDVPRGSLPRGDVPRGDVPRGDVVVVPLVRHDEVVGRLTVAAAPGERLHAGDLRLLRDLASQAGAAAYNVRLTADLRLSKERLVTAREEEWRRVRRELHDRLGPLDGILLGIVAASNTLARADVPGTKTLLIRLKTDLRTEVADIRALIDRLRPRSLDELGLVGAVRRQAQLAALPPQPLAVTVEAGNLGAVAAAVEVAAYQIVSEALTNVRRHANARQCHIRLAAGDGWLELEVADDGVGLPSGFREGVGLCSMRERASELGGSVSVEPGPGGGTTVSGELPVRNP